MYSIFVFIVIFKEIKNKIPYPKSVSFVRILVNFISISGQ